jgi:hypothetical protein
MNKKLNHNERVVLNYIKKNGSLTDSQIDLILPNDPYLEKLSSALDKLVEMELIDYNVKEELEGPGEGIYSYRLN